MRRFCRSLDEDAFRVVAERHYDAALRKAVARLGDRSAAEDAVQEALIRLVRNRRRYCDGRPFAPWFYAILRNVCIDLYRRERRYRDAVSKLPEMLPEPGPDLGALDHAGALLEGLTPDAARLVRLRFFHGFSFAELARELRCSADAAKKRVQRVVRELREQ